MQSRASGCNTDARRSIGQAVTVSQDRKQPDELQVLRKQCVGCLGCKLSTQFACWSCCLNVLSLNT